MDPLTPYDPDFPAMLLEEAESEETPRLKGWRANKPAPEYGLLLEKMSEYFLRHSFEANNELEVRVGKIVEKPRRFVPGVSRNSFQKVLSKLQEYNDWEDEVFTTHVDYITSDKRLRVFEDPCNPPEITSKRSLLSLDVLIDGGPFDIRFAIAKEKTQEATLAEVMEMKKKATAVRYKQRTSFMYKYHSFDLTVVRQQAAQSSAAVKDCFDETSEERNSGGNTYEIELEVKNVVGSALPKDQQAAAYLAESTLLKMIDIMFAVEDINDVNQVHFKPYFRNGRSK
jgi:hypothetical protein